MVSVIIPVYNGAEYLEECLRSVMSQSYRDIEIIVIDDGSTDHSYAICEKLAKEDHRIRVVHQKNAGVSAARNKGLDIARGEYITFVDADDILHSDAIRLLVENAMETDADLVIGSYEEYRFGHSKKIIYNYGTWCGDKIYERFWNIDKMIISPWGKLYRYSIIRDNNVRFNLQIPYGEDSIFNVDYCVFVEQISVISKVIYRYRLGGVASSVKYHPNMNISCFKLVNAYIKLFSRCGKNFEVFIKRKARDVLFASIIHYIVHCPRKKALRKIGETLSVFSSYINIDTINETDYSSVVAQSILEKNPNRVYIAVFSERWLTILLRKIKLGFCWLVGIKV